MIYTLTLNPALDRELTVSEIEFDTVLRAEILRLDYGGKGFNVSRMLSALGLDSIALGFIGGPTGQIIINGLARLGIRIDFIPITGETRSNISIVSKTQTNHIKVNEAGPVITTSELEALLEKVSRLARPGDWWVLSGSLPPGVPANIYGQIIRMVQAGGARAILDTSGPALRYGCEAGPFLVKPNAVEAVELTGIRQLTTQTEAVMAAIHTLGAQNVLISMGKAGAFFSDGGRIWLAESPAIEMKNPIGAGDSSVAGLLWALINKMDWPEALRWSMACGAATATQGGTAVGSKEIVELLAEQVKITEVGE